MRIYLSLDRSSFNVIMTDIFEKREIKSADSITSGHAPVSYPKWTEKVP